MGNPGNSLNAHLRESKRTTQQSIQPLAAKAKAIAKLTRCKSGLGRYRDHTTQLADNAHPKRTGTPDVALSGYVRGPWPTRVVSHGYDAGPMRQGSQRERLAVRTTFMPAADAREIAEVPAPQRQE